jgi:hypothetical protein
MLSGFRSQHSNACSFFREENSRRGFYIYVLGADYTFMLIYVNGADLYMLMR